MSVFLSGVNVASISIPHERQLHFIEYPFLTPFKVFPQDMQSISLSMVPLIVSQVQTCFLVIHHLLAHTYHTSIDEDFPFLAHTDNISSLVG